MDGSGSDSDDICGLPSMSRVLTCIEETSIGLSVLSLVTQEYTVRLRWIRENVVS